jgi:hypothetical protein
MRRLGMLAAALRLSARPGRSPLPPTAPPLAVLRLESSAALIAVFPALGSRPTWSWALYGQSAGVSLVALLVAVIF